jgi:hypothetical protein
MTREERYVLRVSTGKVWDLMRQGKKCEAIGAELLKDGGLKPDRMRAVNVAHRVITYMRNYPESATLTIKLYGIIPEIIKTESCEA